MFNPSLLLADILGLPPSCWSGVGIIWAIMTVGCVIFVWNDCRRGKIPGLFWSVITLVFGVFGMGAYLIYKSTQPDRGWRG